MAEVVDPELGQTAAERINELERQVSELRSRERLLRELFNVSPDIVTRFDTNGRIELISPSVKTVIGYTPEQVLADQTLVRIHPDDLPLLEHFWHFYHREKRFPENIITWRWFHAEGHPIWIESTYMNLRDDFGKVIGCLSIARNVTDRHHAEQTLQRERDLLDAILATTVAGITVLSTDGKILFANRAAEEVLGLTRSTIEQMSYNAEQWHHTDVDGGPWPDENQPFRRVMTTGEPVFDVQHAIENDAGVRKILSINGAPIKNALGEITSLVFAVTDITERKRLEDQLRQAQKMEAVGRLAGGIAHDFNNILTVINGSCDILLTGLPPDHQLRHDAEQIQQAGQRAVTLTRQLLTFSRRQMLQPRILNLNDIVAGIEQLLRRLIGEDIELLVAVAAHPVMVRVDAGQIEQVLLNLAVNARDAMPHGGTLQIETDRIQVEEGTMQQQFAHVSPGSYAQLTVRDNGSGIEAAVKPYIFEPFFTTKPQGKGTGLGLATVHGIVTQSGGSIWFESEVGRGTQFTIVLPALMLPDTTAHNYHDSATERNQSGSETILLAEDEDLVRQLTRRILMRSGYKVIEASNGEQALQAATSYEGKIHMLLTDVVMPGGMSGPQLATRLLTIRPDIKVLYMSGYTANEIGDFGMHGGIELLNKPFTPTVLSNKIREILDA